MLKQNKPGHVANMCFCIPVTKAQILKLVSHWDAKILRLVADKGLQYKCDFFTLRSHWTW